MELNFPELLRVEHEVSVLWRSSLVAPCVATAGLADELPVETFFRNYQYNKVQISPDGADLGVLAPHSNRVGLTPLR